MSIFSGKLPGVGSSIFTIMSRLAHKENAINLAQGFPDFSCDPMLLDLVEVHLKGGKNQYAPMAGVPALREILADKISSSYQQKVEPNNITITSGATQALFTAVSAFIKPGDEVIVIEPAYDSYVPAIKVNGGVPVFISLSAPEYNIPWERVRAAVNDKTKMLIINSPHNPTGRIIKQQDILALEKLVQEKEILILSDEVYEHLVFDGEKHESVLQSDVLKPYAMACFSFGKVLHATGWKLGYIVANEELTESFRNVHQFTVFSCNTPIQYAIADYYKEKVYLSIPDFFESKRKLLREILDQSRFSYLPAEGTYFQTVDYSSISAESDFEFACRITKEHKVASIPISSFYHNKKDEKTIRLCFAKKESTLERAGEILSKL